MPPASQIFAWQGFSLHIPADWNLAHFQGNANAGIITLADLHAPTLTLRWQTPRQPASALAKLLRVLQTKNAQITPLPPTPHSALITHHSISHPSFTGQILLAPTRLYEFETPAHHSALRTPHFSDHSQSPAWPWSLYGISGIVPANFTLDKAALHPGRPQLTFRRLHTTILLGAWPLADQLLARRPLADWARASVPLLRNAPAKLRSATATTATFHIPRKFRRPLQFSLMYDPASNTISWSNRPLSSEHP